MSRYDDKLEARRARLEARADKADAKAQAAQGKASSIAQRIPMGQPILVGHHSERRHRKHLGEIDRAMRTAIDASDEAQELRRRARRVGSAGVSADDPNAIDKLEAKIVQIERDRDEAKKVNAAYRQGGWEAVAKLGVIGPEDVLALGAAMEHLPRGMRVPYPTYVFQNVSSELRRLRERVEALKKGPIGFDPVNGDGWKLEARPDLNRVALSFDRRPDKSVTEALRRGGWRWSPREGAWLRMLNENGVGAAEHLIARLFGFQGRIQRRFDAPADAPPEPDEPGAPLVPLIEPPPAERPPSIAAAFPTAPLPSSPPAPRRAPEQLGLAGAPSRRHEGLGTTRSGRRVPAVPAELGGLEKAASLAVAAHGLGSAGATPAVSAAQSAIRAHFDGYAADFTADDHRDAAQLIADHKWAHPDLDRYVRYAHNGLEQRHRDAADRADKQAWEAAFRGE